MYAENASSEGAQKCPFEVYKEEADKMNKMGELQKAIEKYNIALEMRPEDSKCLVSRGYCFLQLGDIEKSLSDAIQVVTGDETNTTAICLRAESLYRKGYFEDALIYFYRGKKLRPDHKEFQIGIQQCEEAIENAVGDSSGLKLRNVGDLSQYYANQNKNKQKPKEKTLARKPAQAEPEKKYKIDRRDKKTMKSMLGQLYEDMIFLNDLSENNKHAKNLADECLSYLDSRSLFWQEQEPMYSRRSKNEKKLKTTNKMTKEECNQYILKQIEIIENNNSLGKWEKCVHLSKKLLISIKKWSDELVDNRDETILQVHYFLGIAHFKLEEHEDALRAHKVCYEIAQENNICSLLSRSIDNIGRVYEKMGKFDDAIFYWEMKIPLIESDIEAACLYSEIARCYLNIKKPKRCTELANKSLDFAEKAQNISWKINAIALIGQALILEENYDQALKQLKTAKDLAEENNQNDTINDIQYIIDSLDKVNQESTHE